mgnify:FL=1
MRNGSSYNESKSIIEKNANFLDAYRLPPVMEFTQVPVDIIVLQKK